jgi:stress-induced-phosphoprotein 1
MKGDWGKGYGRKGAALHGMGRFDDAIAAYEKGLDVEPGLAMLTKGLDDAKREAAAASGGAGGLGQLNAMFQSPDLFAKIAGNPQTAAFLADPSFVAKMQELQRDPNTLQMHMQDQRVMQVMGMLMGVNIMSPDQAAADAKAAGGGSSSAKAPEPEPEPEVELTEEEKARKAKKDVADGHKLKGNDAYKAKKFEEAVTHYEAAIAELPDEMTYYNNLAAVLFEQKKHEECIAKCKKAIELGRSMRADYTIVAKSFARIGNAYKAMDKLPEAVKAYEDSLMEDRTDTVERTLKKLQADMKKREKEAYINPELAEAARQEGNELFKRAPAEGPDLYAKAIVKYEEAMKRNPKDHVPYSNRAACYQKLMEWQLALKDVETCVGMEPTFVKGWSRKASIHYYLKEYHKAMDAYNEILKIEPDNAEAKAGLEQVIAQVNAQSQSGQVDQERQQRAMADPEIQGILGDPQMRSILQEMQQDPKKAQAAMNDPIVGAKLQKLIAAGVLQVR